jgi:hypothetical protein
MLAHIFVDNSNIFHGAQRAALTAEPGVPSVAIRVYSRNLFALLERGLPDVRTRVFAGAVPPGNDHVWDHARACGCNTDLLRKITRDDGKLGEQGVDELLHLKIANALLDYEPPQTLVLATGDGRVSSFGTGFALQVDRALKRGWHVAVWSWKDQLSSEYRRRARLDSRLHVNELDPYYRSVTFVQAGEYTVGTSVTPVHLAGRIVSSLPSDQSSGHE